MWTIREIRIGVWLLIGLNLMVTFGAIALLSRTTPALETALKNNVQTIGAIETMLAALAEGRSDEENRERFLKALHYAGENITEEGEKEIIGRIHGLFAPAFKGDPASRGQILAALLQLGNVNRTAMNEADRKARRLGIAGAWSVAFLGLVSFWAGALIMRSFRKRIADPVIEIGSVLSAWRQGEILRRCRKFETTTELAQTIENINSLLDDEVHPLAHRKLKSEKENAEILEERTIVQELLELLPEPALIVGAAGNVFAANQKALSELSKKSGGQIRESLRNQSAEKTPEALEKSNIIRGTGYRLCVLREVR